MAAFFGGLGMAALEHAKQKAMNKPLAQAIQGGMDRYRQGQNPGGPQIPSQETADAAADPSGDNAGGGYVPMPSPQMPEPMARGRIVTKPTTALLGESGPEAVVPLNNNPQNRVTPAILNSLTPRYHGGDHLRLRVPHVR